MKTRILQLILSTIISLFFFMNWINYTNNFFNTTGINNVDFLSNFYKVQIPGEYTISKFVFEGYGQIFFVISLISVFVVIYKLIIQKSGIHFSKIISTISIFLSTLIIIYTFDFIYSFTSRLNNYDLIIKEIDKYKEINKYDDKFLLSDVMKVSIFPYSIIFLSIIIIVFEVGNIVKNNKLSMNL